MHRLAGGREGQDWWLLLSPIVGGTTTGNGRGVGNDDPGANGTITRRAYNPTQGGSQISTWPHGGWCGNIQYHNRGGYIAEEIFIQIAVKMDSRRVQGINHNVDSGKLCYFTRNDKSLTDQEIVPFGGTHNTVDKNYFRMYYGGSPSMESVAPGEGVTGSQPGSEFAGGGLCRLTSGAAGSEANCWFWPLDQWCTVLWRIKYGTMAGILGSKNANPNTIVEVYAQKMGEREYTRIWNQQNFPLWMDLEYGHNALICSIYHNANTMTPFHQRYDQVAISKDFIPPRQVDIGGASTPLAVACYNLASGASTTFANSGFNNFGEGDDAALSWQTAFYHGERTGRLHIMGKRANATQWKHAHCRLGTNVWTDTGASLLFGDFGHIYGNHTIDPETDDQYILQGTFNIEKRPYKWSAATQTWALFGTPYSGATESHMNGAAVHPHLFGRNRRGLVADMQAFGFYWDLTT
jgi:hypothetical protein